MPTDALPDPGLWKTVDEYVTGLLHGEDPALDRALAASLAAELPPIQVSAAQGKFLHLLARLHGSRRILEIGTLGGYSTIWLARALPSNGGLTTIELDPKHASVAAANLAAAGLSGLVDLRVGPALEILPALAADGLPPFDFVFIDADKPGNVAYLEWAVKLTRPGSVIILDNVVRSGDILDADSEDGRVQGSQAALEWLGRRPSLESTVLQTVGAKGYDGFAMVLVR